MFVLQLCVDKWKADSVCSLSTNQSLTNQLKQKKKKNQVRLEFTTLKHCASLIFFVSIHLLSFVLMGVSPPQSHIHYNMCKRSVLRGYPQLLFGVFLDCRKKLDHPETGICRENSQHWQTLLGFELWQFFGSLTVSLHWHLRPLMQLW